MNQIDLFHELIHDKFTNLTFEVSCFDSIYELENKPLIGLDGEFVYDDMIIVRSRVDKKPSQKGKAVAYNYYSVTKYIRPNMTYSIVLECLEDKLQERTRADSLKSVVEVPGRSNIKSIRMFELVWEKTKPNQA